MCMVRVMRLRAFIVFSEANLPLSSMHFGALCCRREIFHPSALRVRAVRAMAGARGGGIDGILDAHRDRAGRRKRPSRRRGGGRTLRRAEIRKRNETKI